jgi:hypothetical protein
VLLVVADVQEEPAASVSTADADGVVMQKAMIWIFTTANISNLIFKIAFYTCC